MLKALYGMMITSILYYNRFIKYIKSIEFELNPYDTCVANRIVDGKQHTVAQLVDDVKSSHSEPNFNNKFQELCQIVYGEFSEVKVVRGKLHDYLVMILVYTTLDELSVDK